MIKNYPALKNLASLFFLLFTITAFSQISGDFRSKVNGDWTNVGSWQTYNGTAWIDAATYPGQFAGTGTVTIQNSNNIKINTNITYSFTALVIGGGVSGILTVAENINVSTLSITINAGGIMTFDKNKGITFPANASLFINSPGKIDTTINCTNNNEIKIGNVKYATCTGSGNADFTFDQLNLGGGSLTSNPSYNSPVCGNTINLIGAYTGVINKTKSVDYNWTASGPSTVTFNSNTNASPIATINPSTYPSVYTFTLEVTNDGNSNSKTISVTVNAIPTAPTLSTVIQPTCSTATGSFAITNYNASYAYTVTPSTGVTRSGNTITAPAGSYTVTATLASCASTASANVVVNTQISINTWNGSSDKNWNNAANWSCGVPSVTNYKDVLIPSALSTTFSPTLSTGIFGYVENILFESGSILTVVDNYLFVKTNLTLNGKIDLNNESQLVQGDGSTFVGTGSIEIDQQGTSDNFKYNYWGSPVNTTGTNYTIAGVLRDGSNPNTINEFNFIDFGTPYRYADVAVTSPIRLSTYWMYKYANLGTGYSGWTSIGKDGSLKQGEGFTMKGSNTNLPEQNYTFVGKPNNGDINLTISANNSYLIGNPYPSALDAKQFIRDNINVDVKVSNTVEGGNAGSRLINIIDGNLYFWDHFGGGNHLLKSYEGGYAIFNLSGSVPAVSNDILTKNTGATSNSGNVPQRFIPVAQGFFVTSLDAGEIQFKNSQREFKKENGVVSQFMKGTKNSIARKEINEDIFPRFHLNYSSPKGYHRQLLVAFIENTTDAVDIGYDAINNENFTEDMSWRTNNINFIIQAVPTLNDERILPLEVKVATTGIIKINIDNAENIPEDTEIFIKDNLTGKIHNISKTSFEIELTAGKYTDRFALTFKTQKLVAEDVKAEVLIPAVTQPIIEGIHVFMNNTIKELQIKNNSDDEISSVELFNYLGQRVNLWNSNLNVRTVSLPINTSTGIYMVQINTKTGSEVQKVVVE